jgi:hypothetical protein
MSNQGLNVIADGGVSSSWFGRGPDSPADAEVNKFPSARSLNNYVVTVDEGTTLCNHPDARVSRSGRVSEFYEASIAGLDAQK